MNKDVTITNRYLFKLDKSLLDLNAIYIDSYLMEVFTKNCDDKSITLIKKDVEKIFKLNVEENLIEGRGIKGFFDKFDGDYIFIEHVGRSVYKLYSYEKPDSKWLHQFDINPKNLEHSEQVINSLTTIKQDEEKWFKLYGMANEFNGYSENDNLISLPFIRDLRIFEYQLKTVKAVLKKFKGRVLLCDEVGLGKTVEAGMALMEYITRGLVKRILILVPPSLITQWDTEMKRKFNQDFIKSDDPAFKSEGDGAWSHYNKVIASIATAKRKGNSDIVSKIQYDLVIVDEAHHLKNRNSVAWKFVNSLQKKYIFLLTATPVQNNLEELYNLITLLKPGQLKTYSYFKKNFIFDKSGLEAKNVERLRTLLSDVMIRNRRSNVDITFTKRNAVTYGINLHEDELKIYNEISNFIRKKYLQDNTVLSRFMLKTLQEEMGSSFQAATGTLKRYSENENLDFNDREIFENFYRRAEEIAQNQPYQNPKIQELHKILDDFNDKMIVFTKYKNTQEFIVNYLKNARFEVAEFHGGLKRKEKEAQIEYFKDKARVLVSTEAGGEGRNLQFCNGMINYDLPWNPMAIEQRIGRIHRIGQERDVFVYNLAAKNTVEYYILDLLDRKINMFELVVGEVDMILGDIEEKADFSDIIMDAWINASDSSQMESKMEDISRKFIENKKQYLKVKELDSNLFDSTI